MDINELLQVSRPYFSKEDLEQISTKVREVLTSGWLTSGKYVAELEERLSHTLGVDNVVVVNSCTAAMHAILMARGIGRGDEVILPSNTFSATANAVVNAGAKPVFVDCELSTFNIDPVEVDKAVTHSTAVIIGVNIGGTPCDLRRLQDLADERGIEFIQDAAHSLGSNYHGADPVKYGTASAFSLSATKIITAGEGGFVATDSNDVAEKVRAIRNNGRVRSGPTEVEVIGHNFKMPDINAVIALTQLDHLQEFLEKRQRIASVYDAGLPGGIEPQEIPNGVQSTYYAYICRVLRPSARDTLVQKLKEADIETSIYFIPLHRMRAYHSGLPSLPVSELLGKQVIGLPMGNTMTTEDATFVVNEIKKVS